MFWESKWPRQKKNELHESSPAHQACKRMSQNCRTSSFSLLSSINSQVDIPSLYMGAGRSILVFAALEPRYTHTYFTRPFFSSKRPNNGGTDAVNQRAADSPGFDGTAANICPDRPRFSWERKREREQRFSEVIERLLRNITAVAIMWTKEIVSSSWDAVVIWPQGAKKRFLSKTAVIRWRLLLCTLRFIIAKWST